MPGVEASVVAGVEVSVESAAPGGSGGQPALRIRMLGPLSIRRHGQALPLPASRKVRGLLAWLALAPRAATRDQLCELLWDLPNDPRGELRWCLSKIRTLVDDPARRRVATPEDRVRLDLDDCFVDAIELSRAAASGVDTLELRQLRELASSIDGDFLEGLDIGRSPHFNAWLTEQRRRFRSIHAALLEQLAGRLPDDEALPQLERWLQLAPFDRQVHERLLAVLLRQGRVREAEEHLVAAERLFEADGLDGAPLRAAWRSARAAGVGDTTQARVAAAGPAIGEGGAAAGGGLLRGLPIPDPVAAAARRASIAVMPFGEPAPRVPGGVADALAHDVITRLAKLRSLFVIAQGTVFALHDRSVGAEEAGRMLNVDYVVSGSVRRQRRQLSVSVELSETRTARIVWSEILHEKIDDAFAVVDEIGNRIVASVAGEIEAIERNRAMLKAPGSLDAWEACHRGLWHMYRFAKADNERARQFFETALRLDPTFSRAWAGLSFTHFQNAFQGWADREPEIARAFDAAGRSLMADDRDPAAHWAMGRALWLRGGHEASVSELAQAIELSPNFALAHYTLAFVQAQAGDARAAIASSDFSRRLSPFDPLLFGMLGSRAIALVRLGRFEEAAQWAVRAAARPNAHPHIHAIAAYSLALAGALDEARACMAGIRRASPSYDVADFLAAFRFDEEGAALFREGAKRIGLA